jgi:hypothetical protein
VCLRFVPPRSAHAVPRPRLRKMRTIRHESPHRECVPVASREELAVPWVHARVGSKPGASGDDRRSAHRALLPGDESTGGFFRDERRMVRGRALEGIAW